MALTSAAQASEQALKPMPARALDVRVEMTQKDYIKDRSSPLLGITDREWSSQRIMQVRLRFTGNFDANVTVQWAFIARDSFGRKVAWDVGVKETTIAKPETVVELTSGQVTGTEYSWRRTGDYNGLKPVGYVVRVMQGEAKLALRESIKGTVALLDDKLKELDRSRSIIRVYPVERPSLR